MSIAMRLSALVLLPFLASYGAWVRSPEIVGRAREAFLAFGLPGDSGALRWAAEQVPGRHGGARSAALQQGLLALARDPGAPFLGREGPPLQA